MKSLAAIASVACDAALALVYPQACAICGRNVEARKDGVACARCWSATRLFTNSDTLCWKCGAFSRATISRERQTDVQCRQCDGDEFTFARACGFYEGALRASILRLKREPHVPFRVAELMVATLQRAPINQATVIVPIPLHTDRERERGFNQAVVLARELGRLSRLPVDQYSVVRPVHTKRHRAGMDSRARRQSVASAFAVRHPDLIAGKRVLLIDDVFTTGATASACALALRSAGAAEVLVLTVARSQTVR